jgi:predicted transglutaminase-like cysteine proteinase
MAFPSQCVILSPNDLLIGLLYLRLLVSRSGGHAAMIWSGPRLVLIAFLTFCIPAIAHSAGFPSLFDTVEFRGESLDALPQWQRVIDEIEQETSQYEQCHGAEAPCSSRALLAWQSMIKSNLDNEPMLQLRAVNRFVNRWPSRTDARNYLAMDYWASPLNFLKFSGDCEDYAIIKYASLRQLGFDAEQLRLVVVRDGLRDAAHAVLAVNVDQQVFILDNLFQAVLPQDRVSQYTPYYSVNENARFSHLPPNGLMMAGSPWTMPPSTVAMPITSSN